MIRFLVGIGYTDEHSIRMLGCTIFRRLCIAENTYAWHLLHDRRSRAAIDIAERNAGIFDCDDVLIMRARDLAIAAYEELEKIWDSIVDDEYTISPPLKLEVYMSMAEAASFVLSPDILSDIEELAYYALKASALAIFGEHDTRIHNARLADIIRSVIAIDDIRRHSSAPFT